MQSAKLRGKMKNIFLEDVAYGIYDRPKKSKEEEVTVPTDLPVSASDHMSNQLTQQRPPIEDEDFVPKTKEELSRAVHAIGLLVPNDQVEFFYNSAKKLLDACNDREFDRKLGEPESKEDSSKESAVSEAIKKTLKGMINEIQYGSPDEYDEFRGVDRRNDTAIDYFGENEPLESKEEADGELTLDQIAAKLGYKSASGVRQEIKRLTDRLQYFVTKVEPAELEQLTDEAASSYIDIWSQSEDLDPEDVNDLKSIGLSRIKKLPAFRYFFVDNFIMPSYREATREATRALNTAIDELGVPENLKQAVFNEVTGASSPGTIAKRMSDLVKNGSLTKEQKPMMSKVLSSISSLRKIAEKQADFIQRSRDKWNSKSNRNKKISVGKAIEMAHSES